MEDYYEHPPEDPEDYEDTVTEYLCPECGMIVEPDDDECCPECGEELPGDY